MSNVLRSTTFQLEFNGADGITGVRTFTKAVKDADATVAELNAQLGQNATVTYKTVQSKKELTDQARLIANQFERNVKATENLMRSLQHQMQLIGKNEIQQASMNAAFSLGATATDEQRAAVSKLATALATMRADEAEVEAASDKRIAEQRQISKEIEKTEQNYRQLAAEIRNQIRMVGESSEKQEINNAVRRLGANATDEQKRAIAELTARLARLKAEQTALAAADAKANAEKQKAIAATDSITQQYKNMAAMVGKTADEIEQLNAVQRLGSNATEAQRQQVLEAVQNYQQLRGATEGASGSFRDLRGTAQNAGWQLQDVAVQLQMGTSGFVVFSQQASQFVSAFGPGGAVLGAVIAVAGALGGVLYTSLNESAGALDRLTKLTDEYNKYLTVNAEGVTELSSRLNELAQYSRRAADEQLRLARGGVLKAQAESIKVINKEFRDFASASFMTKTPLVERLGLGSRQEVAEISTAIRNLKKEVTDENLENYIAAISKMNPSAKNAKEGLDSLKQKLLDQFYELSKGKEILEDTANGWEPISEKAVTAIDEITKAFESEYDSLVKQTESTEEEYERRKQFIDDYVAKFGSSNEKVKRAYDYLNQWKMTEDDKEFQNFYNNLIKKTNTVEQEYDRQKKLVDDRVQRMGTVDAQSAASYVALEKWKTDEITKEYDRRERIRRQIEKAQVKVLGDDEAKSAEKELYDNNMKQLKEMLDVKNLELSERNRIGVLIENETARHNQVMEQLNLATYQNQLAMYGMAVQQMTGLADMMANGVQNVKNQTANMNAFQKTMFVMSQTLGIAMALINGQIIGMQLAKNAAFLDFTGLSSAMAYSIGVGMGAASAGAIAGVTIAGAFDKGGNVPAGQFGIVSEYGDELVNGMLVKGPARVTSREDTAKLLNGAGGTAVTMKVSIENQIKGGQYDVRQISPDEVKIIAKQVFDQNIDQGVSSTIANPNSKSAKSMRSSYNVSRNLNGN